MADKRVTPARPDLAAAHLKGVVDAPRFAEGEKFSVCRGRAALRVRPSEDAAQDSELLFGETFTVYDCAQGWAWGQAANDLYVGYLRQDALTAPFAAEARVTVLMAPVFSADDLKTPVRDLLPLNAAVPVLARQGEGRARRRWHDRSDEALNWRPAWGPAAIYHARHRGPHRPVAH